MPGGGAESDGMIEDRMHGVVENDWLQHRDPGRFRLSMYAPEGDIKRSTHLDGRGLTRRSPSCEGRGRLSPLTDRGLGIQSWEAARNLNASVLFVETKDPAARRATPNGHRSPPRSDGRKASTRIVIPWLRTVDVVYAAETFYDRRFTKWASQQRHRTVLHANPEFWTGADTPTCCGRPPLAHGRHATPHRGRPFPVATDRFNNEPIFRQLRRPLPVGPHRREACPRRPQRHRRPHGGALPLLT